MESEATVVVSLINNAALLLAMGVLYDAINPKFKPGKQWHAWVFGLTAGALCIALMLNPLKLLPGVTFDTRSILLSITALYFGFIPAGIAAIMACLFRWLYIGGGGAITGVSVIIASTFIGCLWRYARRHKHIATIGWTELYILGLTVHVVMLLLMSMLPNPMKTLEYIGIPVITIYPIATILLGKLLAHQLLRDSAYISLTNNRNMLANLMNSIPHFIFWKDRNSTFLGCNDAFARAAGLSTPEEIVGKTDFDLPWLPEEAAAYRADDKEVMENNKPKYHITESQLTADGTRLWIDTSKIPLTNEDDEVYGILGIYENITERKREQDELQKAKEFAEKLLNTANAIVIVLDKKGKILVFNEAAEKITGYKLDELQGRNWFEVLVPRDRYPEVWEQHKTVVAGKASQNFMNPILTKSGEEYYIVWQNNELYEQGHPVATISFGIDITERKRAEEELCKSQGMLSHIFNSVPHHIFWKDRNSIYQGCNAAFAKAAGVDKLENIVGKTDFDLPWLPDEAEKYRADDREVMENNCPKMHLIEQQLQANGKRLWVDTTKLPLTDATGKVYGIMGIYEDVTERKTAEDEIKSNEARLRRLVNILQHPSQTIQDFLDYALEQTIQLTGSKIGYIYHYNEERKEFVLNTWSKEVMPDCAIANPQSCYELEKTGIWGEAIRQRKPIVVNDFEAVNPMKKGYPKGHLKLERFMTIPIFRDERIVGVIGLANKKKDYDQTDILQTSLLMEGIWKVIELKKVEDDLIKSEERYHSYIENAPYGVFVANENAKFVQVNPAASEMTGYDERELLSMGIPDILHEESMEAGMDHFRRSVATGQAQGELSIRTKSGEKSRWSVDAVKLSDTRFMGFCRDITALRKAESDYRILFREMLEGFALHEIILDDTGKPVDYRFLAVNPAFEHLTGLKADNIIGRTVLEVLPQTEKKWIETYGKVALTSEPAFFEDYSSELNKHFEVSAFSPAAKQFACILSDITERKRVEEQLRQAQKLESIGRLAGGVAHDFNNLLTPILGYTELLQKHFAENESVREDLGQIQKAAELARDLTRQLLAFSRKQILNLKPVDMRKVLTGFEKLLRLTLRENVKLVMHLPENMGTVMADASLIEQVLMNLAVNAQDAMPTGGVFSVELGEIMLDATNAEINPISGKGRYVIMSVSDTGVGMDKATIERIFEPFFTTKEKTKGTGLGLAMVFGIVKQHGGNITVYSTPGNGTTFRIYLPIIGNHYEERQTPQTSTSTPVGGTETILIVEDNEAVREMARKELMTHGYKVLTADDAEQCIKMTENFNGPIHLVVSDIIMPGMNGMELCKKLLASHPDMKVLYISGYTHDVIAHHGMIDADIPLLSKPFTMDTLSLKIREILDRNNLP